MPTSTPTPPEPVGSPPSAAAATRTTPAPIEQPTDSRLVPCSSANSPTSRHVSARTLPPSDDASSRSSSSSPSANSRSSHPHLLLLLLPPPQHQEPSDARRPHPRPQDRPGCTRPELQRGPLPPQTPQDRRGPRHRSPNRRRTQTPPERSPAFSSFSSPSHFPKLISPEKMRALCRTETGRTPSR